MTINAEEYPREASAARLRSSRLLVEWLELEFPDWIATSVLNRDLTHAPVLSMTRGHSFSILTGSVMRHYR